MLHLRSTLLQRGALTRLDEKESVFERMSTAQRSLTMTSSRQIQSSLCMHLGGVQGLARVNARRRPNRGTVLALAGSCGLRCSALLVHFLTAPDVPCAPPALRTRYHLLLVAADIGVSRTRSMQLRRLRPPRPL